MSKYRGIENLVVGERLGDIPGSRLRIIRV